MKLELLRYSSGDDSTLGLLCDVSADRRFMAYTLEDEQRDVKVAGETRIPAGTYQITLREEGGFHQRYLQRFPDFHRGMLWLRDVPGFEYILIHVGNDEGDTAGCILVGDRSTSNVQGSGMVALSVQAYRRLYLPVATVLEMGGAVSIEIIDYDGEIAQKPARRRHFR